MNPELSKSFVEARAFLYRVHQQLAQLITELDTQLDEHGWAPTNKNVTAEVSAALNADRWLTDFLYRFYFPKALAGKSNRLVGTILYFDLPKGWTEPVALAFGARFEVVQSHSDIWSAWKGYSQDTVTYLAGKDEVQPVSYDVFKGFLPKATAFRGVALPVFSLTGPDDLRERVTNVLLRADVELGT